MSVLKIISNIQTNSIETAVNAAKHESTILHAYSLICLTMIDSLYNGLEVTITLLDKYEQNKAFETIIHTLQKCEANKVEIRSYRINGVFQTQLYDINLTNDTHVPTCIGDYQLGYKSIVDINAQDVHDSQDLNNLNDLNDLNSANVLDYITMTFYKLNCAPKKLTLLV